LEYVRASFAFPTSAVTGIVWPALPHAAAQTMMAAQFQLEHSQWWPASQLAAHQLEQLRALVAFTVRQVPHYRALISTHLPALLADPHVLTWGDFARWPILKKADLREQSSALLAADLPRDHGAMSWRFTSGSTGTPVRCAATTVSHFFRSALILRNQLWHELDFSLKYAEIRPETSAGRFQSWGPAPSVAYETGPSVALPVATDIAEQLDWLMAEAPGYLHSNASNLRALLLRSRQTGQVPVGLDAVISYAETMPADLRALTRELWNTRLIDVYSCTETGVMALQCPQHDHYHAQSELVILEVLDEDGLPCPPGNVGRVVVTDLVNFAMPLIRYELGDYAEAGVPCDCGRGLPVIARVMGRRRNMALDLKGRMFWPYFSSRDLYDSAPLGQIQLVQHTPATIELRYVMQRELSASEQASISAILGKTMGHGFDFRFTRVVAIERKAGEKFEEFISLCLPELP
jgi:phenylacetate-CoA ligase